MGDTMTRGRPKQIDDRITLSVSISKRQYNFITGIGVNISEFVRESVDLKIESLMSPEDQLEKEIEEKQRLIEENQIILAELRNRQSKVHEAKKLQIEQTIQENEFISQRIELFNNEFSRVIHGNAMCPIDFYSNVKKILKFEDMQEAKDWLLLKYKEPKDGCKKYSEERIKTFLRYDSDISRYW